MVCPTIFDFIVDLMYYSLSFLNTLVSQISSFTSLFYQLSPVPPSLDHYHHHHHHLHNNNTKYNHVLRICGEEVKSSSPSQSQPQATDIVESAASQGGLSTPVQLALILVALCLDVFLAAIDSVIITPTMPTITKELNASDAGFAWIGSAYLLALSATSPFWSKVSDIFGRKPILIVANVIFLIESLVATLSNSLVMLIAARAVQGTGGGGLITLVEISVGDMFSQRERGLFYGIYGAVWAVSTAIGPVIGELRMSWQGRSKLT